MKNPQRSKKIVSQAVGDGLAVFDPQRHQSYALNATSALVFQHCDGQTTPEQLTELLRQKFNVSSSQAEQLMGLALDELGEANLLQEKATTTQAPQVNMTRRNMLKLFASAGLSLALMPFVSRVAHAETTTTTGPTTTTTEPTTTTTEPTTTTTQPTTTTTQPTTTTTQPTTTTTQPTTTTTQPTTTTTQPTTTTTQPTTTTTQPTTTTTQPTTTTTQPTTTTTQPTTTTTEPTTTTTQPTTTTTTLPPVFPFVGFFPPVDNRPTVNEVNAGRSIPIKFSLKGNRGLNIIAAGYPVSQAIAANTTLPISIIEETTTANQGLTYDVFSDQYTYVWKTEKSWAGAWRQFILRLKDGTNHIALFKFK